MDPTKEDNKDGDSDSRTGQFIRPNNVRRKSISDTLNSFTSQHFSRRRMTTDTANSKSADEKLPQSRLPLPAAISRSSSFFNNLAAFASKSATVLEKDKPGQSVTVKRTRKLSERFSSTHFFSQAQPSRDKAPTPYPRQKEKHSVQIAQHGLMQPIHPGVPRSSTTGHLGQQATSGYTPSFMRPTSSSTRRHSQSSGPPVSSRNFTRPPLSNPTQHGIRTSSLKRTDSKTERPSIPAESSFLLAPANELDEDSAVEYETDEEVEIGAARATSITPVRSVSSHNPFSENNFAYGLPDKHDKSKRDSSKPFDHLISRPVRFEAQAPRRNDNFSKPLPLLTPDRSREKMKEVSDYDEDVAHLEGLESIEYYRRGRDAKPLEQTLSNPLLEKDYKLEGVEFATTSDEDDFNEEDTVIYTGEGDLIKGAFASVAGESIGQPSNQGDHEITSPTTDDAEFVDPRRIYTAQPASFWLGRVTALSDRFRTEALAECMNALPRLSINEINTPATVAHPMHDDNRRYRRVFVTLYGFCETEEARASLREFQGWWEQRRLREMGGMMPAAGYAGSYAESSGTGEVGGAGTGKVKEKKGVFEKLGLRRKGGLSGSTNF